MGQALAAELPGSLGKGADLPGLPPGPCQSPGKALSLPVLSCLPAGVDPAPPQPGWGPTAQPLPRGCVYVQFQDWLGVQWGLGCLLCPAWGGTGVMEAAAG